MICPGGDTLSVMRVAVIIASFLPFAMYAWRDHQFHFRGRRVSATEHALHAMIGLSLILVVSAAVSANTMAMAGGLIAFMMVGAVDEYVWHRNIPGEESDLHAKEHLALMIFVLVSLGVNELPARLPQWIERFRAIG